MQIEISKDDYQLLESVVETAELAQVAASTANNLNVMAARQRDSFDLFCMCGDEIPF